ncbi:ABC transporter substrate-binding protein [Leifsonia sp. 2MCAF36]|uniref:ABC transporter substrate-binding protein n=1 Tax=Leifsonia sp. 2MCAF36 TaxID=3232988 RepID=UPI003F9E0390
MKTRTPIRRRLLPFAVPLVAALALAGCSPSGTGNGSSSGPVTLTLATETRFGKTSAYEEIIKKFNESNHQGITVRLQEIPTDSYFQTIRTQFQAGSAPDVVWGSPGTGSGNSLGVFAKAGQLVDLSKDDWATKTVPKSAHDLYYTGNALSSVPVDIAPISEVVNSTAFTSTGIAPASTFAELLKQCSAVTAAGGTSLFGLAGSQSSNTGLAALELAASRVYAKQPDWNAQRAAGKVTFADSAGWKATLESFLKMKDSGCFQPGSEGGAPETVTPVFASGKILSIFAPAGIAAQLAQLAPKATISVAALPGAKATDTFLFASPTNALAINAGSKHIDAAKTLLKFWTRPENLDAFAKANGNLSLTTVLNGSHVPDQYASLEPYLTDPKRNAPLPNLVWPDASVYDALGTGVQGLLTGQTTVDQVLASMDSAWG